MSAVSHSGNCCGWGAKDKSGHLTPFRFDRRECGSAEVELRIEYCGICHSDLHMLKNEWGNTVYPVVPGHEICGVVTRCGPDVKKFKVGDKVGVGCMVGSCKLEGSPCSFCAEGCEQFCSKMIQTYSSKTPDGSVTYGGYSERIVVNEEFVLRVPDSLPLEGAAPLLCAGITVWAPMKAQGWLDKPGMKLGVVGLGGLGHMAVKIGTALGHEVTVISTSPSKAEEATAGLGAAKFLPSGDEEAMKKAQETLDGIIDTVSAPHDLSTYLELLKPQKTLVLIGISPTPLQINADALAMRNRSVTGTLIGGVKDTQEMLDFCGEKGVTADVEVIPASYLNEAMERMLKSDVKFRFVIDVARTIAA